MQLEKKQVSFGPRDVTHRMIMTNQMHQRMMEKNLEGTGIHRAQHRLLMTLSNHCFVSQIELARHLGVTAATIAVSLKSMEREQLICRRAKKEDNRANFIEITEKGRHIIEESREYFDMVDEQMYRGFSQEERKQLAEFLDRIYANMEQLAKQHNRNGGQDATV